MALDSITINDMVIQIFIKYIWNELSMHSFLSIQLVCTTHHSLL